MLRNHAGKRNKRMLPLAASALLLALWTPQAMAGETEAVLKLLLKKGIITQAEYDEVLAEVAAPAGEEERTLHQDKHILHKEDGVARVVQGLSIGGGVTMVAQGSSGNGTVSEGDTTDGSYSADLELSSNLVPNGELFLHLEAGEGGGLEGEEITSYWGVNGDAGDSEARLEVTEAWYEHRFGDRLVLSAGKLDLTSYFDNNEVANDETLQFLSPGFVNSIVVEFPENSGGARLTTSLADGLDLSLAWQTGDGDWEGIFDNPFLITELDLHAAPFARPGNYRLYAWTNQVDKPKLADAADQDNPGWGVGLSLDQELAESLSMFLRAGYQDDSVYEVAYALSGGLALKGGSWNRPDDVLGVAFGRAWLADDQEKVLSDGGTDPGDESHFEAYYSYQVNEYLALTPNLQAVINANGDDNASTIWVGGVRGQFTF